MRRSVGVALVLGFVMAACSARTPPPPVPTDPAAASGPAAPADPFTVGLAMVLLTAPTVPSAQAIIDSHAAIAPDEPPLTVHTPQPSNSLAFVQGETPISVALVPGPVPSGEAEAHAFFALETLLSGWRLPAHAAFLLVMADPRGDATPIDRVRRLHRLYAAVTHAAGAGAVGVYIGNAGVTHDPALYVEVVRKQRDAVAMWSGIDLDVAGDGRNLVLSTGMRQFGLPEVVVSTAQMTPHQAFDRIVDIMFYVMTRGAPLADGESLGLGGDRRVQVRSAPHPRDPKARVIQIDDP